MSYTKMALESTDPSFQCSTKIEMTASDIEISAEWDMRYESFRDEEEAKARAAALGENREDASLMLRLSTASSRAPATSATAGQSGQHEERNSARHLVRVAPAKDVGR